MKIFGKKTLAPFDWFLIIGSIFFYILHWWLVKTGHSGSGVKFSLLGAIAGMSGLIGNVLCAKRNISNYFFGIINVTLYGWIAWQNKLYGDVALNILYYLPMQFVGFYYWLKNRDEEEENNVGRVKSKRLSNRNRLLLIGITIVSVIVVALILKQFNDPQPFKDSATTVIAIIAMALMVGAYMEQWWLWIVVNIISTIIWIVAYKNGGESSGEMIIKWFFNLANSINGYIVWSRASKKQNFS